MNDVFANYAGNPTVRNMQIVYLHEVFKYTPSQIAKYVTDIALSTIRSYIYKFKDLLDKAKKFFGRIKKDERITFECNARKGNCAYIIEYFNSEHNFLFLKVGMTNNISRRIKEHFRTYQKQGVDVAFAVVKKLYFAKDEDDALTLENILRKHYKQIENGGFLPRDRFLNIRFNAQELESDIDTVSKLRLFTE